MTRRTLMITAAISGAVLAIATGSYFAFSALLDGGPASAGNNPTTAPTTVAVTTPAAVVSARPAPDAGAVLAALQAAGVPLKAGAVQDATNDPNRMLGRSTGYQSRASFDLPGGDKDGERYSIERGGVIEVWATSEDADARVAYIDALLKGAPLLGTEYHYQAGPVLVRVTGTVAPDVAAKVGAALAAM